jgi:hypothetical protein
MACQLCEACEGVPTWPIPACDKCRKRDFAGDIYDLHQDIAKARTAIAVHEVMVARLTKRAETAERERDSLRALVADLVGIVNDDGQTWRPIGVRETLERAEKALNRISMVVITTQQEVTMADVKTIKIDDDVEYVRADAVKPIAGKRIVLVVDRGWIFAGDATRENGRIKLSRALHVFSWAGGGFAAVCADPRAAKVDLRKIADVDVPEASEVFCVPVHDAWGL